MSWLDSLNKQLKQKLPVGMMILTAALAFHAAYLFESTRFLIGLFLFLLVPIARASTTRTAFYSGLILGLFIYAPQLSFFYGIFGAGAFALWLILAFWLAIFTLISHLIHKKQGDIMLALSVPFLWTGIEYFRSELYYLRFSWLNIGFVFSNVHEGTSMLYWGVYGTGFMIMALAGFISLLKRKAALFAGILCAVVIGITPLIPEYSANSKRIPLHTLKVAGVQAEFPGPVEIPLLLDKTIKQFPNASLLVMSEYSLEGPVPEKVKTWCQKNGRYLIIGGKDATSDGQFFNTAFVVGPDGTIVFQQSKKVPIQFFKDGKPAPKQLLWESPWGKLGICICYDLSYRRVVDRLVQLGAEAIIIPTMDVAEWGQYEHELHARVGPARAKEFGIPIIRLASSGISQWIDAGGNTRASAPFPGESSTLYGVFNLSTKTRFPLDRWLAPVSAWASIGLILTLLIPCRLFRPRIKNSLNSGDNARNL